MCSCLWQLNLFLGLLYMLLADSKHSGEYFDQSTKSSRLCSGFGPSLQGVGSFPWMLLIRSPWLGKV